MLTLFVVQSRADALDPGVTLESFDGLVDEVHFVPNLQAVNGKEKKSKWYCVVYDNEHIDEPLKEGLKVFVQIAEVDVLVLLKKHKDKYSKAPRLFRRDVRLRSDSLLPANKGVTFETVLNGWIHDNDQD